MMRSGGSLHIPAYYSNFPASPPVLRISLTHSGAHRMNALVKIGKAVLPARLRGVLRAQHRKFVFRRAMRRFLRDPEAAIAPGSTVMADLVYGWGNDFWSALDE